MTRIAISLGAIATFLGIGALAGCNNTSTSGSGDSTAPSTTTSTVSTTTAAYTGQELAGEAQVTLERARESALGARPGTITDQELERESGGSGLRYSFDILSSNVTYEVGIDAKTGAVLENAAEGSNPD